MVLSLMATEQTEGLLERAKQGDSAAFDALLKPKLADLRAAASRLSRSDADDLVSETLVGAFSSIGSLEQERAIWSWLFRILLHKHYDLLRKRMRERRLPPAASPTVFAEEEKEVVRKAVDKLPARERRVLELRYFDGKNSSEIGETLKMPAGTVRSILFNAMRTFEAEYRRMMEE
jgi:RNA polymerase sigma-70 factor (ECF subfamily)